MTKAEFEQQLFKDEEKETRQKWLTWLLTFARKDLTHFKSAEWDQLAQDFYKFFQFIFGFEQMWKEPFIRPAPQFLKKLKRGIPKEFKTRSSLLLLNQKLRTLLEDKIPIALPEPEPIHISDSALPVLDGNSAFTYRLMSRVVRVRQKDKKGRKTSRGGKGSAKTQAKIHLQLVVEADWPFVFWLVVAYLLETHSFELTRCEECRTLFVQAKQEAFCSLKCANRYRGREWYRTHFNDPKVIDRRRKKYEEKIQQELPNAKIRPYKQLTERRGHRGTQERQRPGHFGMAPRK